MPAQGKASRVLGGNKKDDTDDKKKKKPQDTYANQRAAARLGMR